MENDQGTHEPHVSIIVVNFNGGGLLTHSVAGALSSQVPVEVFVVDNGSTDGSIDRVRGLYGRDKRLVLIENRENLGFARATNIALGRACGEFVLLLNPDCILSKDTLKRVVATLREYPDAGMSGCLILNPDGTEQAGCRRSVPTPWRTVVRVFHLDKFFPRHHRFRNFVLCREPLPSEPSYLEGISGAFMLVRREAVEQVGLLDEGYFLHCEDLDWCMRFRRAGWKILFVPDVEVVHHQGACSADRPIFVYWHKHRGMVRFYRKFFRHQYSLPLMVLVVGSVWMRFGLLVTRESLRLTKRKAQRLGKKDRPGRERITLLRADRADDAGHSESKETYKGSSQCGCSERRQAARSR